MAGRQTNQLPYALIGVAAVISLLSIHAEGGDYWRPWLPMFYGGIAPLTLGVKTYGISLIIVLIIESFVIFKIAGITWQNALIAAIVMNLTSFIFGGAFSYFIGTGIGCFLGVPIFLLIALILHLNLRKTVNGITLRHLVFWVLFLGWGGFASAHQTPPFTAEGCISFIKTIIFSGLTLGFGVALTFEVWPAMFLIPNNKFVKTVIWANICSFIFLLLLSPFFWPNPLSPEPTSVNIEYSSPEDALIKAEYSRMTTPEVFGLKEMSKRSQRKVAEGIIKDAEMGFSKYSIESYRASEHIEHPGKGLTRLHEFVKLALKRPYLNEEEIGKLQEIDNEISETHAMLKDIVKPGKDSADSS